MGKYDRAEAEDIKIVERVGEVADKYGVTISQLHQHGRGKKGVVVPIVGSTKTKHLDDAVNALAVNLTDVDVKYMEELYFPYQIVGAVAENPAAGTILIDEKNNEEG